MSDKSQKSLQELTVEDLADPDTYSYTEGRGGRSYDVKGIGSLVNRLASQMDGPTGQLKREIREGQHAERMAEYTREIREEKRLKERNNTRREEKIKANLGEHPGGYEVRIHGNSADSDGEYVIDGPYNEHVREAMNEIGGAWDGDTWRLPVRTHRRLREIVLENLDAWTEEQQRSERIAREEADEVTGTYGPVTVAKSGHVLAFQYDYDKAINAIVESHGGRWSKTHSQWWVKMDDLDAARAIISGVKALTEKRAEKKREQKAQRASSQPQGAKKDSSSRGRRLVPYRERMRHKRALAKEEGKTFDGFGKPFRVSADAPSIHGSQWLGREGSKACYIYYSEESET